MTLLRMTAKFDLSHTTPIENSLMRKTIKTVPTHFFIVPANIYTINIVACGGGAAGSLPNLETKEAGNGGAAGYVERCDLSVQPGQRFEIYVGCGGKYECLQEPLTRLQVEQNVYDFHEAKDTIIFDCENNCVAVVARAGQGFCGGRAKVKESHGEYGIASFQNGGTGFCDASGKWIGYGGGGGGGRYGGVGGCVYSNKKSSKPGDAEKNTGCGGGGSALVLTEASKHFLPGAGAAGYVHIQYDK